MTMFLCLTSGCAELKYRVANVNGERSEAQIEKDWKECYALGRSAFHECTEKKGYYMQEFMD